MKYEGDSMGPVPGKWPKHTNPVAKHSRKFNKGGPHVDRKKEESRKQCRQLPENDALSE